MQSAPARPLACRVATRATLVRSAPVATARGSALCHAPSSSEPKAATPNWVSEEHLPTSRHATCRTENSSSTR
eukprot:6325639-Prymnesium_polylepis.1